MEMTKPIRDLNGYELANLADLGDTGVNAHNGKAGYEMLDTVRALVADAIENGEIHNNETDIINDDRLAEIADSAVPVYYHDIFEALVELRAWGEDISDTGASDLTTGATLCLFFVCERLARNLAVQYAPEPTE